MSTVWERVKGLEGKILKTEAQGKSFEIIDVSAEKIQWKPLAGKGTFRSWPRKDIETMYEVRVKQGSLSPRDIREHWPDDQNSSYVPVIVNAVYQAKTL